jgi:Ca-activated chloride channel family protein
MAKLAQNSDGNTYFVENSQELPRIFKAELGDVLSVAAKKVDLAVECAEGVRPIAVIGREGRIKGQTMELSLNQLYGGQEKYVLLEVEVSAGKHGLNRELAIAKATYDNACTSTRDTARGSVRCRFSNDRAEEKASVNAGVLSAYHVNLYSVAEAEAIELADAGKIADAALKLDEAGQRLLKAGRELSDKELEKKGDYLIAQAVEIRKDGLSARNRKLLRSDAFQNINQQSYR